VLAATAAGLVIQAPAAHAADNGAWSVFPSANSGAARLYFTPEVKPGTTYKDAATVINKTNRALTFNIYAADAFTTRAGEFALARRTDPKRDVAVWTHLPFAVVQLGPHTTLNVPFTVQVPKHATPGDHVGGIVAEATSGSYQQRGQLGVSVLQAVATRLYLRVRGPLRPALSVQSLHLDVNRSLPRYSGGPVDTTVTYMVKNVGNVRVDLANATTKLRPLFGSAIALPAIALPELLPGSELQLRQTRHGVEPLVSLSAAVSVVSPITHTHASTHAFVVPWLLVLLLFAIAGTIWWRRRRRRPRARTRPGSSARGRPVDIDLVAQHDAEHPLPDDRPVPVSTASQRRRRRTP
jgi:hypothetical protein